MITSIFINDICKKCGGYKFAPYNSNLSATVRLCHCIDIKKEPLLFPKLATPDPKVTKSNTEDDEM
jgi:hypothetical protein